MNSTELTQSIDARLQELRTEITTLEDARKALTNGHKPAAPPARKTRPARQPRRAARRKPSVLTSEKLEQMLTSDGITTSALAEQANAKQDQVLGLLRDLEAAGKARRSGQRRGTRWHLVTDEDRIAARAAELEGQSRRSRKLPKPLSAGIMTERF
jgi:predicted Rossmann fold nucleotide-binding protein DprA/Smf involved in DNA uptake